MFSVFVLSLCGIIYELILGSLASYLVGNPVLQYSITIGFFLSSMGLGSYLSRYFNKNLIFTFIIIEIILGLVGGISVLIIYYYFSLSSIFYYLHIFFLVFIGTLVGLEIPLITRVLKQYGDLKDIIANVLTLDYIGGLVGSLAFPLLLYPFLGRLATSFVTGILNTVVAMILVFTFIPVKDIKKVIWFPVIAIIIMITMLSYHNALEHGLEQRLYEDDIVFSKRSKFQKIVLTRHRNDFRLYLDGSLQFSSSDEYRYHEMLILPGIFCAKRPIKDVLIMGGGDGLAVKNLVSFSFIQSIDLVELDPEMIHLARQHASLSTLNNHSLRDPRVKIYIMDAFQYIRQTPKKYDFIIADFPDPHDEMIAKLYSREMYHFIQKRMHPNSVFVTQSTSPLFAGEAFWNIHFTMKEVFHEVIPYHVFIPSFGEWGFNIASFKKCEIDKIRLKQKEKEFRYFSQKTWERALIFAKDEINSKKYVTSFNSPRVFQDYLKGWQSMDY